MKKFKRIFLIVLPLTLVLIAVTACFVSANAASDYSGSCGTNLSWTLNKDTGVLSITGMGAMTSFEANDKAPWAGVRNSIKKIEIAEGVTSIGKYAFYSAKNLESINIPSSVTSIGSAAFHLCASIESISVAEQNSKYVSIDNCLIDKTSKTMVLGCGKSVIPTDASVVTSIANYSFYGSEKLESITVPANITRIGKGAFASCPNLKELSIPFVGESAESEKTNFGYIFGNENYKNHKSVVPESLQKVSITGATRKNIPNFAFYECRYIEEINLPEEIEVIGESAFYLCNSVKKLNIPASVTEIKLEAFYRCYGADEINFAENSSLKIIGDSAFKNCILAKTLIIPKSVVSLGEMAFHNCEKLTSIAFEKGSVCVSIGKNCFGECPELQSVVLPFVGEKLDGSGAAFFGHIFGDLKTYTVNALYLPKTLKKVEIIGGTVIGEDAFRGSHKIEELYLPATLKQIGANAFMGTAALKTLSIEANDSYKTVDNCLIDIKNKVLLAGCYTSVIPDDNSISSIADNAFYMSYYLKSAKIPASVKSIGDGAFYGCYALSTLEFGDGSALERIGSRTFAKCYSLTLIKLPKSLEFIGKQAFEDCDSLDYIILNGDAPEASDDSFPPSVVIYYPDGAKGYENPWHGVVCKPISQCEHTYESDCHAICLICGAERVPPHKFGDNWRRDGYYHWRVCECGEITDYGKHEYAEEFSYDDEHHWHECVCGDKFDILMHDFEKEYSRDEESHWFACECGARLDDEAHDFESVCDTDCSICGYEREPIHAFSEEWSSTSVNHWHECECGAKADEEEHSFESDFDKDCEVCGYERSVVGAWAKVIGIVGSALVGAALLGIGGFFLIKKLRRKNIG